MKTREDLEQQLELLQSGRNNCDILIKEVTSELEALPKVPKRWRAEIGGQYLFIGSAGDIRYRCESGDNLDNNRWESFNYFKARTEAERIATVQLAYRTLDWAMSGMEKAKNGAFIFINQENELEFNSNLGKYSPLPQLKLTNDITYIIDTYPTELRTFLTGGRE